MNRVCRVENRFTTARFDAEEIIFIEHEHRKIRIHTRDRCYSECGSMEAFLSRLPKGVFHRCHQSLAVNFDRIVSITCKCIELEGGIRLIACRAALQRTKRAWERYLNKS